MRKSKVEGLAYGPDGRLSGIVPESFVSGVISFSDADLVVVNFADVRESGTRTTQVMMSENTTQRLIDRLEKLLADIRGEGRTRQ